MSSNQWCYALVASTVLGLSACSSGGGTPNNDPGATATPGAASTPTPAPATTPTPAPVATPTPGSGEAAALQSLQGSWFTACVADGNGGSERIRFVFDNMRQTVFEDEFSDPSCNTRVRRKASISYGADISVGGTVTTSGGMEARKIDVLFDPDVNGDREQLLTIFKVDQNGQRLLVGDPASDKDADGRDTALDFNAPFGAGEPPPPMQSGTNTPPILVSAGEDFSVDEGRTVSLAGDAIDDEDEKDQLNALWTRVSGPEISLVNETTFTPDFEVPQVDSTQTLVLRLTVTDTGGLSDSDDISITINDIPVASGPCDSDSDGGFDCATQVALPYGSSDAVDANSGDFEDYYRFTVVSSDLTLNVQDTNNQSDILCALFASTDQEAAIASSCTTTEAVSAGDYFLRVSASSSRAANYTISISQ